MTVAFEAVAIANEINLTWKYDNPVFNGEDDLYEAIIDLVPAFDELNMTDKLIFSLNVFKSMTAHVTKGKQFTFNISKDFNNERIIHLWDMEDYQLVYEVSYDYLKDVAMSSPNDVLGLYNWLVKQGELLPQDKLMIDDY